MTGYRCYLLDADDHILQAHDIDCADDTAAGSAAEGLLKQDPYHRSAEVWQRTRRIIKVDRDRKLVKLVPPLRPQPAWPVDSVV